MAPSPPTVLDLCAAHARTETAAREALRPQDDLIRACADLPPTRGFAWSLRTPGGFGLIAEIKHKSPSKGPMRAENVAAAADGYQASPVVRAVSILTQETDFGTTLRDFAALRVRIAKPILRKDFILTDYQVYEARATGADAILLMCQLLSAERMQELHDLAQAVGLDVLVETQRPEDLVRIPRGARVVGINSRDFMAEEAWYQASRQAQAEAERQGMPARDATTNLAGFERIGDLPEGTIKVAESGVKPGDIGRVKGLGYQAALVGTGLLLDPRGLATALGEYEQAVQAEA